MLPTTIPGLKPAPPRAWGKLRQIHLLFVAQSFPAPGHEYQTAFLGHQVRMLSQQTEGIRRITVVCPITRVPSILRRFGYGSILAEFPKSYIMEGGKCSVIFPRYIKAPKDLFLNWTKFRWIGILDRIVGNLMIEDPVDIVHANLGMLPAWASLQVARKYQLPTVVTYQGSEIHTVLAQRLKGWQLCRDSFQKADLNLLVSRSLERTLREHTEPQGRCELLLRGVDGTIFFPAQELQAKPRVLFVGRVTEKKGVLELLDSWQNVRASVPDALLTLAGPDHSGGAVQRAITRCGLHESVRLAGALSPVELAEELRRNRMFCLPSHGEGTPNSIMEALACGLPVVASRVGGIPDLVKQGVTGLLFEPKNIHELTQSLLALLRDPDLCRRMGGKAQEFARDHLDARSSCKRLVQLYQELVTSE